MQSKPTTRSMPPSLASSSSSRLEAGRRTAGGRPSVKSRPPSMGREAVAGGTSDELDVVESPVDCGHDRLLGVGEAVDEEKREHVVLQDAVGLDAQLRFEPPGGLRRALDAEAPDVEDELAVDFEAAAGKGDGEHAALHHAGGPDLAGRRTAGDRHAGKGLGERMIEGGRVVIDGEEDDDVLEVGAAEPGF